MKVMAPSFYRGTDAAVFAYDICNTQSMSELDKIIGDSEKYLPDNVYKVIVGCKADLDGLGERQVTCNGSSICCQIQLLIL